MIQLAARIIELLGRCKFKEPADFHAANRHRFSGLRYAISRFGNRQPPIEYQLECGRFVDGFVHGFSVQESRMSCRTTEGFYDTASRRSQKPSQHNSVYQKEPTLPKRRCPRRCKPMRDNGAINVANQMMLQRRSRGLA